MKSKIIGFVLDISNRHTDSGKRLIDLVKKQIISFIKTLDDEDVIYLFHPDVLEVVEGQGQATAVIANHETDGYKFDLSFALKQTLYVLANQKGERHLFFLSDRLDESKIKR
jgi:hypothetical protein